MIDNASFIKYVARCDACGLRHQTLADGFDSVEEAVNIALSCGWSMGNEGELYCVACMPIEPS